MQAKRGIRSILLHYVHIRKESDTPRIVVSQNFVYLGVTRLEILKLSALLTFEVVKAQRYVMCWSVMVYVIQCVTV